MSPIIGNPLADLPSRHATPPKHTAPFDTNYRVTIYERAHPQRRVVALLGDTPPTPSAGGGFQTINIPKRRAVTVWQGPQNLLLMDVPIILVKFENLLRPIADEIKLLTQMWHPDNGATEPPVLKLRAAGNAVPYQQLPWVLSDFTWGDAVGDTRGHRTLQKLTLQFMEYVPDERLHATHPSKHHHHRRTHKVKPGETLVSIARRYKIKGGWRELGKAQHPQINDPRNIKAGQLLVIPNQSR